MAETHKRGRYIGPVPTLKGQTAQLICFEGSTRCLATFDNIDAGYGLGTHDFAVDHFELFCEDEGCPHHGTDHVCKEQADG